MYHPYWRSWLSWNFAPVVKLVTVCCLLVVAAVCNWPLYQLHVNNAFLHGDLDVKVYIKIPPRFFKQGEHRVYRLNKSLYRLKQASHNWFAKFSSTLLDVDYSQSKVDHSLFTSSKWSSFTTVLVYMDDIIITSNNATLISILKKYLYSYFQIKDLGNLKYFLGVEVARSKQGIYLSERKYVLDILHDTKILLVGLVIFRWSKIWTQGWRSTTYIRFIMVPLTCWSPTLPYNYKTGHHLLCQYP